MKNQYLLISFVLIIFFLSCKDDKAIVPAFLKIDDIVVKTLVSQGSPSDKITDIDVFIDDQSIGTFELPVNIPIQKTGNINLKIRGVIYKDGQSTQKVDYPFYTTFELDTILIPEVDMLLTPAIGYQSTTIFDEPWSGEDFETGVNFNYSPTSDTVFTRVSDDSESFEGSSGLAYLSEEMDFFEAWTPTFSDIPRNGKAVWLEMDYKSTHQFAVSIFVNGTSISNQEAIVFFREREEYGKVYIELNDDFATRSGAFNYTLAIGFPKPIGEVAKLYVDNVKLVRF